MSERPFIIEMPSWAYAWAEVQPKVFIRMVLNAWSAEICEAAPLKPPSKGMIEKLLGVKPSAFAWSSIWVPNQPVPAVVPGVVTETYRPGLSCCRICAAPISLATAVAFSYSGSSRSKSMACSP